MRDHWVGPPRKLSLLQPMVKLNPNFTPQFPNVTDAYSKLSSATISLWAACCSPPPVHRAKENVTNLGRRISISE